MLSEIYEEGGLSQVGQGHFLALAAAYFCPWSKLLIKHDAPLKIFHHFSDFSCRVDFTEFAKSDGYLFPVVILPEYGLASVAECD